jgi:hypothetical protein
MRPELLSYAFVCLLQFGIQMQQILKRFGQQPPKMLVIENIRRSDQLPLLVLQARLCELRQFFWNEISATHLSENQPGRLASEVADHRAKFHAAAGFGSAHDSAPDAGEFSAW